MLAPRRLSATSVSTVNYHEGSWEGGEGGTSAATPLWAALTALVDADCSTDIGFANPTLYKLATTAGNFHDVTVGNNDWLNRHKGTHPATKGYDQASGLAGANLTSVNMTDAKLGFGCLSRAA